MSPDPRRNRGLLPAAASSAAAAATVGAIVVPAEHPRLAITLVLFGLLGFSLGMVVGSPRMVALAGAPIFGAAVIHVQVADEAVALWALGVGCGWYIAVELAWESINRQIECRFDPATGRHRTQEILTVVAMACLVATIALAASNAAPRRTVLLEAAVIIGVLVAGAYAVRRLATVTPDAGQ